MIEQTGTDLSMNGAKGRSVTYNAATDNAEAVINNATKSIEDAVDSMTATASKVLPETREIANRVASATSDFANQYVPQLKSKVYETIGHLPKAGREVAGKLNRHARANPWLHIGLAGAGAFALGYLLGRQSTTINAAMDDESVESKLTADALKAKNKPAADMRNSH